MAERDSDFVAAVLEREDLAHSWQRSELAAAVDQGFDNEADPGRRQIGERRGVIGTEAHHLASALAGPALKQGHGAVGGHAIAASGSERRKAVLEYDHVIVVRGDLSQVAR
jgi:hypothetical protein